MTPGGAGLNGYRLVSGPPQVTDYLELRKSSGLTPRRPDQAAAAIAGSWSAVHVVAEQGPTSACWPTRLAARCTSGTASEIPRQVR